MIFEAVGMEGEFATYLIRSLLSERRVRYETVEKGPDGPRARVIEREGPTGLITTTTAISLHPENETRMISIPVDDTPDQTRRVIDALAAAAAGASPAGPVDLLPWHALQQWLEHGERRVVIPFAQDLAQRVPAAAVRLRRDFGAILSLVKAHALLHRASRDRDAEGRIVATIDDYAAVRALVVDLVAEGIDRSVSATVRETVEAVERLTGVAEHTSVTKVAAELGLDRSVAHRRVRSAMDKGYLRDRSDRPGRGRPLQLAPGDPVPADQELLPLPDALSSSPLNTAPPLRVEDAPGEPSEADAVVDQIAVMFDATPDDDALTDTCPRCGGSAWWPNLSGRLVCGRCHPPVSFMNDPAEGG